MVYMTHMAYTNPHMGNVAMYLAGYSVYGFLKTKHQVPQPFDVLYVLCPFINIVFTTRLQSVSSYHRAILLSFFRS